MSYRLDQYLTLAGEGSRSQMKQFLKKGLVQVDGITEKQAKRKVLGNEQITLNGKPVYYEAVSYTHLAITAFIGPSGCGKSTFLKCLNRMNDLVENVKIEGKVLIDGEDIYSPKADTTLLRKKVGMVFQQANPFPMSIYDNIAYGPRIHGIKDKATLDQIVEESLRGAAIFDEVKDRLKKSALGLSGGQQQRLSLIHIS